MFYAVLNGGKRFQYYVRGQRRKNFHSEKKSSTPIIGFLLFLLLLSEGYHWHINGSAGVQ